MEDLSKKPVKICNDRFLLKLTKDKLKAVLQLVSEKDSFDAVPFDEIVQEVRNHGVSFGFVQKLPQAREGKTIIACGTPAVPGENAKVKPVVKPVILSRVKMKKSGKDRVDFRELGHIVNVPKGQLLLKKILATAGTPGKNVLGEEIPCKPGKDVNIKCGPGVVLSEDGMQVSALVDGKFVMGDGKPSVYEEHVITGNVDLAVGNIAFCGTRLEISGEVQPGFKIKCKGDVFIGKGVNSAQVLAGGSVRITGGLVGQGTEVRAKGDIQLDFCENFGLIETRGALRVENFVVQGNVKTGGGMTVMGGKGAVMGGSYVVGGSMHVKDLGSEAEVVTEVTVGLKPELEKRKRQVEAAKAYWPDRMNEILKNISALNEMKKAEGKDFGGEKANVLAELNTMMPEVMEKNNQLTEMQMQLDKELEQASSEAIYVYGSLYPGVVVTIGKAVRVIDKQEQQVVVELQKSTLQIHVRAMNPEERAVAA
ncbi:MAG: FapA family protein [Thermodesulfobacteriota bacterium]